MIDLQKHLEEKICSIISNWNEDDIYVISFFLNSNESYEYNGYSNITQFSIGYNTEKDCIGEYSIEKRWNYAFWRHNEIPVIEAGNDNESIKILFDWYRENGINNIGYEDVTASYDKNMNYIGKGPIGYYELLSEITSVAKRIQDNGFLKNKFGKTLPVIIHDLEYPWYIIEANKTANSNGEANEFFAAMKELGIGR